MGVVILDRQHGWKSNTNFHAGVSKESLREVDLTRMIIAGMWDQLEHSGHKVYIFTVGTYRARHQEAARLAKLHSREKVVYLAQHINSIEGAEKGRAVYFYDKRSLRGRQLAEELEARMDGAFEFNRVTKTLECYDDSDKANGWLHRPFTTIEGIYDGPANLCGVCSEPVRMQDMPLSTTGKSLFRILHTVAQRQSSAVNAFLRSWA